MRRPARLTITLATAFSSPLLALALDDPVDPAGAAFFDARIRPVLIERCYTCHAENALPEPRSGLILNTRAGLRQGGATGPIVIPGKPDESLLIRVLEYTSEVATMPPEGRLPDTVIDDFRKWITMGAPTHVPVEKAPMNIPLDAYSPDYHAARDRFRATAEKAGWTLESHPMPGGSPSQANLSTDVAISPVPDDLPLLILSSGLHGVEGPLGSAAQLAILERAAAISTAPATRVRMVLIHALNPYGYAVSRRFDPDNVDANRNFLLPGQPYAGSPPGYARFNALLNPRRPPTRLNLFLPRAAAAQLRHGLPALKEAIVVGQYDHPFGLFFGGHAPGSAHLLLAANLPRWVASSQRILHLDIHTGLGRWATGKLLLPATPRHPADLGWLTSTFPAPLIDAAGSQGVAYHPRGEIGAWCQATFPDRAYLHLCAEFGTYPPLRVLAGLRAENQAHHWALPDDPATLRARNRLRELFAPSSPSWRTRCLQQIVGLVDRSTQSLGITAESS